jgi:uncharacterized protein HemY
MVRGVDILRKTCPECIVERAILQSNLGVLRLKQKRYREADEALTTAVELREKFTPHQDRNWPTSASPRGRPREGTSVR